LSHFKLEIASLRRSWRNWGVQLVSHFANITYANWLLGPQKIGADALLQNFGAPEKNLVHKHVVKKSDAARATLRHFYSFSCLSIIVTFLSRLKVKFLLVIRCGVTPIKNHLVLLFCLLSPKSNLIIRGFTSALMFFPPLHNGVWARKMVRIISTLLSRGVNFEVLPSQDFV